MSFGRGGLQMLKSIKSMGSRPIRSRLLQKPDSSSKREPRSTQSTRKQVQSKPTSPEDLARVREKMQAQNKASLRKKNIVLVFILILCLALFLFLAYSDASNPLSYGLEKWL